MIHYFPQPIGSMRLGLSCSTSLCCLPDGGLYGPRFQQPTALHGTISVATLRDLRPPGPPFRLGGLWSSTKDGPSDDQLNSRPLPF